jgi:MFS family permease
MKSLSVPDRLRLLVLCAAQFMLILDVVVVNVAIPAIQRDLGGSAARMSLVGVAYTLTFGALQLAAGRAGDRHGRRRLFTTGIAVFTGASLLAGLAQSGSMLIGARVAQGVGAAMVSPTALALLTTSFREGAGRNLALGVWGAVGSAGAIAGQLVGGALTSSLTWRSVFLVNVPVGVVVWAAAFVLLRDPAGNRAAVRPLRADLRALATAPSTRTGSLVLALNAGVVSAALFFTTLYLQTVAGMSPWAVGLGFAPVTVMVLLVSPRAGTLVSRHGVRPVLLAGALAVAAGLCLLTFVPADGTYLVHVLPGLLLVALGSGLTYAPAYIAGTTGVPDESQGLASGLLATGQELGAAGGLGFVALLASSTAGVAAMLAQYRAGFAWAAALALLTVLVAAAAPRGVGAALPEKDLEGVR